MFVWTTIMASNGKVNDQTLLSVGFCFMKMDKSFILMFSILTLSLASRMT